MKISRFALFASIAIAIAPLAGAAEPLFDGKTTTGWTDRNGAIEKL